MRSSEHLLNPCPSERNPVKASSLILWLCVVFVGLVGCSTPCEDVCSTFNECTLAERGHKVDCSTYCEREQLFEEKAASVNADTCKTQFDAYISCWDTNSADICNAENTSCDASLTAWTDCVAKFCAVEANATDPACVPQDEGPALPALGGF
jgi:hypothetical protein